MLKEETKINIQRQMSKSHKKTNVPKGIIVRSSPLLMLDRKVNNKGKRV